MGIAAALCIGIGVYPDVLYNLLPWPVDYRTSGREGFGLFRDNPNDSLQNTTLALREWIGLVAYRISGRIDSAFPQP